MKKILTILSIILAVLVIGACVADDSGSSVPNDNSTGIEKEEGQIDSEEEEGKEESQEETQQEVEDSQDEKTEQNESKNEAPAVSQKEENKKEDTSITTNSQPTKKEEQSSDSQSVIVPEKEDTMGNLVWVPVNGGTKYHSKSSCSNMKDPKQVTKEHAEQNGYTACKRCY